MQIPKSPQEPFAIFTNSDDGSWMHNSYMPCFNTDTQDCTKCMNTLCLSTCKHPTARDCCCLCSILSITPAHNAIPHCCCHLKEKHYTESEWLSLLRISGFMWVSESVSLCCVVLIEFALYKIHPTRSCSVCSCFCRFSSPKPWNCWGWRWVSISSRLFFNHSFTVPLLSAAFLPHNVLTV